MIYSYIWLIYFAILQRQLHFTTFDYLQKGFQERIDNIWHCKFDKEDVTYM